MVFIFSLAQMKNTQHHGVMLVKRYFRKSVFLQKSTCHVFILIALFLLMISCNDDDMDTIRIEPVNESNVLPAGTSESITAIIIDNGLWEFNKALQYVNDELYTALVAEFETGVTQYTVFIPSNKAFYKLYDCLGMKSKDIAELGDPGLVRDILQYHVVKGRWDLDRLRNNNEDSTLTSFYGESFTVMSDGRIESVENSSLIDLNQANKFAKNGVVHIISDVILPIEVPCNKGANQ